MINILKIGIIRQSFIGDLCLQNSFNTSFKKYNKIWFNKKVKILLNRIRDILT